ncbi:hypothetical protein [Clostridium mediterraneense]|uniref:hypothetical protein n=1 Tax=Clostridium mediterraneense TaxID=1805472 RepID=UPI00082CC22C|nr:hypothetical protein [Clostridium mediterraneense]
MQTTTLELFNSIVKSTEEESLQQYVLKDMLQNYTIDSKKPLEISGFYTIIRKDNKDVKFENVELYYKGPLIFTYCNHSGEWFIRELNDFKQVEEYILGAAGCFNMFTGIVLVIYDGNIRKYDVVKILPNGEKVILDPTEDEDATDAIVEWI